MTIHEYIGIPEEHRAVLRSSTEASTYVGPFLNEYVWFLKFDEAGEKIVDIIEFMDSSAVKDIFARLESAGGAPSH